MGYFVLIAQYAYPYIEYTVGDVTLDQDREINFDGALSESDDNADPVIPTVSATGDGMLAQLCFHCEILHPA